MRPPGEIIRKKLLKRVAFPLLNRLLGNAGTHLYHYSTGADRLYPITGFGSETYRYFRAGSLDSDRWWSCVRTLEPGGTILDVGANAGYTAAWFATVAARVFAFEPHPANVKLIEEQLRIRGIGNVEIRETAVSDTEDPVDLHCKQRVGHHSLADIGDAPTLGVIRVPCTTLDSFLRTEGIDDVTLLKIDVEGFEPEVLRGAREALTSGAIPRVLFEYSPAFYVARGIEATAPLDILSELGFRLFTPDWEPLSVDDLRAGSQCDVIGLAPGVRWAAADTP